MKNLLFIALLFMFPSFSFAQKYDANWVIGAYDQGMILSFQDTGLAITTTALTTGFNLVTSAMSDAEGNLLYYSNGTSVFSAQHELAENGDSISFGTFDWDYYAIWGNRSMGDFYFIPKLENEALYLHSMTEYSTFFPYFKVKYLRSTVGSDGSVIEKNRQWTDNENLIVTAPIRHGNGRDWWIVGFEFDQETYHKYLFAEDTITEYDVQTFAPLTPIHARLIWPVFSPDGQKLAYCNKRALYIYDFDRCTGQLSNQIKFASIDTTDICESYAPGVSFSPSSRFLYITDCYRVYQYDMWADDIESSRDTVAVYDSLLNIDSGLTVFDNIQLAPDGKIYGSTNGNFYHVINSPDLQGDSCHVIQRGVEFPSNNSNSLPYIPNYRLYDMDGAPCDTLGITGQPSAVVPPPKQQGAWVKVFPNPATDYFLVQFAEPKYSATITLTNAFGEVVHQAALQPLVSTVWVKDLAAGVYFYSIESGGAVVSSGKVVKL